MRRTSLLLLMRSLGNEQIKRLHDFVRSPYHNKKSGVILLCDELSKHFPDFDSPALDRMNIWNCMFPGEEFNYAVFKNMVYDLKKTVEKFISIEGLLANSEGMHLALLEHLRNSGSRKLFTSSFESLINIGSPGHSTNAFTFQKYYRQLFEMYFHKEHFEGLYVHKSKRGDEIRKLADYFLLSVLIEAFDMYNMVNIRNVELNTPEEEIRLTSILRVLDESGFVNDFINNLDKYSKADSNILSVYYEMYKALREKSSAENFKRFAVAIEAAKPFLPPHVLSSLYILLLNSLVNLHVNIEFICSNYVEISRKMMNSGVYISPDGRLRDQLFVTYISFASNLLMPEAIAEYMNKYGGCLQEKSKESLMRFAEANYYFASGDFDRSLQINSSIRLELFPLKYYIKNLQIRLYYEIGDYDAFVLSIDAYRHFLSDNKELFKKHYKVQELFCSLILKMFRLRLKYDHTEALKIQKKVSAEFGDSKVWMAKKIRELLKQGRY